MILCEWCGREFEKKNFKQKFCSTWCSRQFNRSSRLTLAGQLRNLKQKYGNEDFMGLEARFFKQRLREEKLKLKAEITELKKPLKACQCHGKSELWMCEDCGGWQQVIREGKL